MRFKFVLSLLTNRTREYAIQALVMRYQDRYPDPVIRAIFDQPDKWQLLISPSDIEDFVTVLCTIVMRPPNDLVNISVSPQQDLNDLIDQQDRLPLGTVIEGRTRKWVVVKTVLDADKRTKTLHLVSFKELQILSLPLEKPSRHRGKEASRVVQLADHVRTKSDSDDVP
jgi:hypothetical protein